MRLRQLIKDRGLTQSRVAEDLNIAVNTFNHYVTGKRQIPLDRLKAIAAYFGVTTDYILEAPIVEPKIGNEELPVMMLPVYGMISAGAPVLMNEDIEEWLPFPKRGQPEDWLCLRVHGDSMNNAGIVPGCIAVFHRQPDVENGKIAAVAVDDEATIKTFYRDGDYIVLYPNSSNLEHHIQRYDLREHNIRILGVLDSIIIRLGDRK